jgi:hypothetical protein
MAFAKSQSYKVDNRFSQAQGVDDSNTGLNFLGEYIQARKNEARLPITFERSQDDRFIFPALSGTIPIGALPSEPRGSASIGNTDGSASFRNIFRAR